MSDQTITFNSNIAPQSYYANKNNHASSVYKKKKNNRRKQKRPKKPRNTTDFKPNFDNPDLRIKFGNASKTSTCPPMTVNDVFVVPELFCKEENLQIYNSLLNEIPEETFCPWHEKCHVIANDRHNKGQWKKNSPTFQKVIKKIEEYFNIKIAATRLNWYRPGEKDWKMMHRDRAAFTPNCPQNLTVAATFGPDTREVGFEHHKNKTKIYLDAPNGSAYTFSRDVNCEWKHGVIASKKENKGRISIIAWGINAQDTTGSRITENDVPTAKDLKIKN